MRARHADRRPGEVLVFVRRGFIIPGAEVPEDIVIPRCVAGGPSTGGRVVERGVEPIDTEYSVWPLVFPRPGEAEFQNAVVAEVSCFEEPFRIEVELLPPVSPSCP